MSEKRSGVDVLIEDHRNVSKLFKDIMSTQDEKERTELSNMIIKELSQHSSVEEQILYPTIRELDKGYRELLEVAIEEHLKVNENLFKLDKTKSTEKEFNQLLHTIREEFEDHIKKEEEKLFPLLQMRLSKADLERMGSIISNLKVIAPSKPNPHSPSMPSENVLAGPVASFMERIREHSKTRPKEK